VLTDRPQVPADPGRDADHQRRQRPGRVGLQQGARRPHAQQAGGVGRHLQALRGLEDHPAPGERGQQPEAADGRSPAGGPRPGGPPVRQQLTGDQRGQPDGSTPPKRTAGDSSSRFVATSQIRPTPRNAAPSSSISRPSDRRRLAVYRARMPAAAAASSRPSACQAASSSSSQDSVAGGTLRTPVGPAVLLMTRSSAEGASMQRRREASS
jgi:hypothetical protein